MLVGAILNDGESFLSIIVLYHLRDEDGENEKGKASVV